MKEPMTFIKRLQHMIGQLKPASRATGIPAAAGTLSSSGIKVKKPQGSVLRSISWSEILRRATNVVAVGNLKKLALGALVASVILFLVSLGHAWLGPKMFRLPKVALDKVHEQDYVIPTNPWPFEQYAQAAKQHKVFNAQLLGDTDQAIIASETNMVKDLNLLGIIGDADPQAIIEDKKSHETYYVKKGKMIGDMQVADILPGKVIILYGGERYELNL